MMENNGNGTQNTPQFFVYSWKLEKSL